jgi:hypothetical protein
MGLALKTTVARAIILDKRFVAHSLICAGLAACRLHLPRDHSSSTSISMAMSALSPGQFLQNVDLDPVTNVIFVGVESRNPLCCYASGVHHSGRIIVSIS